MQLPQTVEIKNIRVLTTSQIAKAYETKEIQIHQNFKNNRARFIEGKHYIALSGDELKAVKNHLEKIEVVKNRTSHLYLWTEKGALLHAKSLNTDKAWEVYDYLVDFYFRAKEKQLETKQPDEPAKRKGRIVVDAPENPAIQKSMQEIRKYLTSIDVALIECNKYCCEESYMRVQNLLDTLWLSLGSRIMDLRSITPKLVEKCY